MKVQRGTNTRQGDWQLELENERGLGAWKSVWRRGVETVSSERMGLGGVDASGGLELGTMNAVWGTERFPNEWKS